MLEALHDSEVDGTNEHQSRVDLFELAMDM